MLQRPASEYLLPWHGFDVGDATRVVFAGDEVTGVVHVCPGKDGRPRPAQTIGFKQPTFFALPAGYCKRCDVLYLGAYEERANAFLTELEATSPARRAAADEIAAQVATGKEEEEDDGSDG